jgi:hypothetical protein
MERMKLAKKGNEDNRKWEEMEMGIKGNRKKGSIDKKNNFFSFRKPIIYDISHDQRRVFDPDHDSFPHYLSC